MRQDVYGEISTIKQLVLGMDMDLISICSDLIVCGHLFWTCFLVSGIWRCWGPGQATPKKVP